MSFANSGSNGKGKVEFCPDTPKKDKNRKEGYANSGSLGKGK